jgi:hypothetical protein
MSMETEHRPPQGAHGSPESGYERRDVNVPALLKFGFWMAMLLVVTFLGMRWTFNYFGRTQPLGAPSSPFANTRELPPSPRLQVTPHLDLQTYCQGQEAQVNSYGWVDQRLGVVRIPVDRAMGLVLEHGLPARSSAAPAGTTYATPKPAPAAGGADLQGPCGYLAPPVQSQAGGEEK